MDPIFQDLRYAARRLTQKPGFAAIAIITLALGIGANTAIFAALRGVLLRPLPYSKPDRLVMLWNAPAKDSVTGMGRGALRGIATGEDLVNWRARASALEDIAAAELWGANLTAEMDLVGPGGTDRLRGALVTPNFFRVLGVPAARGRLFSDGDAGGVAVLSDQVWTQRFGADPAIIGRTIDLVIGRGSGRAARRLIVVGILPPSVHFTYPDETEVWVAMTMAEAEVGAGIRHHLVGRLKPDVTVGQAQANMTAVADALGRDDRRFRESVIFVEPIHEYSVGQVRPALFLLGGVTAFVLLIACLNIANLMLAHSLDRRRDIATRFAVGAQKGRIVRLVLIECLILSVLGASAGMVIVTLLQPALRALMPISVPRIGEIAIDVATLCWAGAMTAVTSVLAGVLPAWYSSRIDVYPQLKAGGFGATSTKGAIWWRQTLTMTQVAVVLVLLVTGGLLLRTFSKLQQVDPGFDGRDVLTMEMRLMGPRYVRNPDGRRNFYEQVIERVRSLPSVTQASVTSSVPFRGVDWMHALPSPLGGRRLFMRFREVDPDYFPLMRIPILAGRNFTIADTATSAPVVIVSASVARTAFPGQSAVGQFLDVGAKQRAEIVGVVADVRHVRVEDAGEPAYYGPRAQWPSELICLVVRAHGSASALSPTIRSVIHSIDPELPVQNITTLDAIVSESIADRRFYAVGTAVFAALALLLAGVGICALVTRSVIERTREIGVRVAFGATPVAVTRLMLRQALMPVVIGISVGWHPSLQPGHSVVSCLA